MVEQVDTSDLKSAALQACRFDSGSGHHLDAYKYFAVFGRNNMAQILLKDAAVAEATLAVLKAEIEGFAEEHIQYAVKNFEQDLRGKMGQIVLKMLDRYSVERRGSELLIKVDIEDKRKP